MILTCPSCGTQYVVKDGAIPPQGRQVRCASCKHSWHQDPEDGEAPAAAVDKEPAAAAEPVAEANLDEAATAPAEDAEPDEDSETLVEATMIEPRAGPEAEQRAYEESLVDEEPPTATEERGEWAPQALPEPEPGSDEDFSPFAPADEDGPRRRSPLVAVLVVVLLVVAAAALFWFAAPDSWKSRIGLSAGGASPLALVTTHMDRQRLESGNELLTVTGRVINPTGREQPVPPLQAQLKSATGKVVYSWTIAPPAQSLPPGASASFNSAEVNVPPGGEQITLTLGPAKT
ncbi:MAG: zinc-ribbon domain-containing protein [Sphingomicrobium sp.]